MAQFLTDGFSTILSATIAGLTPVVLKEKEVTPPGINMGGPIKITSMRNLLYRTQAPKHLITVEDFTIQAEYDPHAYEVIVTSYLGVNTLWTITFPDGTTDQFYGWLEDFKPTALKEGDLPLAECKIVVSNRNAAGVETGPILN